jgi:soluble lytic murein transglycosylase-like protein
MKKLIMVLVIGLSIIVSASNTNAQDNKLIHSLIWKYSIEYNVPTRFADSIIFTESKYDPTAIGQRGEYGLGQILCSTARGLGFDKKCESLKDPETNIKYTMMYLRWSLDESNNDLCHAAAIYSSGSTHKPKKPTPYCKLIMAGIN